MILWTIGEEPGHLVLEFPAPTEPVSINKANTLHWAARVRLLGPWRDLTRQVAQLALTAYLRERRDWWPKDQPVNIQVALPFRTAVRRDPHNYTGTVIKSVVDGLVLAGVIPDDSAEWATIMDPELDIQRDRARPLMARVTITPRSTT